MQACSRWRQQPVGWQQMMRPGKEGRLAQMRIRAGRPTQLALKLNRTNLGTPRFSKRALSRLVQARNQDILRRRTFLCAFSELQIAEAMLRAAKDVGPGPEQIASLWCARKRLEIARRIVKSNRVNLMQRVTALEALCARIDRNADQGEAICPAFDGHILIICRDAAGYWSERRERVH
jgi:hypothetical protein